jgi:hypothetical protein
MRRKFKHQPCLPSNKRKKKLGGLKMYLTGRVLEYHMWGTIFEKSKVHLDRGWRYGSNGRVATL